MKQGVMSVLLPEDLLKEGSCRIANCVAEEKKGDGIFRNYQIELSRIHRVVSPCSL